MNPRRPAPSSESWCLVCCKCKMGCWTCVYNNTINFERYLRVEGQHLQHLLWSVNCNCYILNVIGRQACWFVGKIRMRHAAGGCPVAVKRRAMEPVNKVKILPVLGGNTIIFLFLVRWNSNLVISDVPTAVTAIITVVLDVTPSSVVHVYQRF
jgi:hypothetical protein